MTSPRKAKNKRREVKEDVESIDKESEGLREELNSLEKKKSSRRQEAKVEMPTPDKNKEEITDKGKRKRKGEEVNSLLKEKRKKDTQKEIQSENIKEEDYDFGNTTLVSTEIGREVQARQLLSAQVEPSNFGDEEKGETEEKGPKIRRKNRKMDTAKVHGMDWEEALELLNKHPNNGLFKSVEVRERRHVSFPFHQLANIEKSLRYISEAKIGKYKKEVRGVVLAVGSISSVQLLHIIDDQPGFHFDVIIEQLVFRPRKEELYTGRVTVVNERFVTVSLFGHLSMVCPMDKVDKKLRGVNMNVGDSLRCRYKGSTVKNAICILKGEVQLIVEKAKNIDYKPEKLKQDNSRVIFDD